MEVFNKLDRDGNPSGGYVRGIGIIIDWQEGPLEVDGQRVQQTGAMIEDILSALIARTEWLNYNKFRCRENSLAITKMEEAMHWLNARTEDRIRRGVEGTHQP